MYRRGFTIVELLIVIVIIAILATITVVAYNGITQRSQASAVASDLRATIKGFMLYKEATGMSTWTVESDSSWNGLVTGNPTIASIITYNSVFREFLTKAPANTGTGSSTAWLYDNEGDTYVNCQVNSNGVNLILQNVTNTTVAQLIDAAVDDGDTTCGAMHMSGTSLIYNLSKTP
ncbi:MAG: prepilin-type N-terminal cleavage/methylation domain-containing protein [Candidatus Saccharimonas sp.]